MKQVLKKKRCLLRCNKRKQEGGSLPSNSRSKSHVGPILGAWSFDNWSFDDPSSWARIKRIHSAFAPIPASSISFCLHSSFKHACCALATTPLESWWWRERKIKWEARGGREVGGTNFGGEKRLEKLTILGREDVFLVHPWNSFNGLILN
jgi:hypothetical protein